VWDLSACVPVRGVWDLSACGTARGVWGRHAGATVRGVWVVPAGAAPATVRGVGHLLAYLPSDGAVGHPCNPCNPAVRSTTRIIQTRRDIKYNTFGGVASVFQPPGPHREPSKIIITYSPYGMLRGSASIEWCRTQNIFS
jgi:hypothetical protein